MLPRNKRRSVLNDLGYDWHPALQDGRSCRTILEENCKPRLFIRQGHPALQLKEPSRVVDAYMDAQARKDDSSGDAARVLSFG